MKDQLRSKKSPQGPIRRRLSLLLAAASLTACGSTTGGEPGRDDGTTAGTSPAGTESLSPNSGDTTHGTPTVGGDSENPVTTGQLGDDTSDGQTQGDETLTGETTSGDGFTTGDPTTGTTSTGDVPTSGPGVLPGETGLEAFCRRYEECGGSTYRDQDTCIQESLDYWGDCVPVRTALDNFGACMAEIACEDYNPDAYNPASTDCARLWSDLRQTSC